MTLDTAYMELLLMHQPAKPRSREEWAGMKALLDVLVSAKAGEGPEMLRYIENLAQAVLEYEKECEPGQKRSPLSVLRSLMESRGVQPSDLAPVLGSISHVARILRGRCPIGRTAAENLGRYFRVNPRGFL